MKDEAVWTSTTRGLGLFGFHEMFNVHRLAAFFIRRVVIRTKKPQSQ